MHCWCRLESRLCRSVDGEQRGSWWSCKRWKATVHHLEPLRIQDRCSAAKLSRAELLLTIVHRLSAWRTLLCTACTPPATPLTRLQSRGVATRCSNCTSTLPTYGALFNEFPGLIVVALTTSLRAASRPGKFNCAPSPKRGQDAIALNSKLEPVIG